MLAPICRGDTTLNMKDKDGKAAHKGKQRRTYRGSAIERELSFGLLARCGRCDGSCGAIHGIILRGLRLSFFVGGLILHEGILN